MNRENMGYGPTRRKRNFPPMTMVAMAIHFYVEQRPHYLEANDASSVNAHKASWSTE